jgi:type III pantothenate kinase
MLLAIDAGNTNIVFAVFDGDRVAGEWRSHTVANRTADEYAVWLTQLMALQGLNREDITGAIIANVVPATGFALSQLCTKYFKCEPQLIGSPDVELGIRALIERPEEVGADRIVNAYAAHEKYRGPLIVVDFGTATTFDVVDGEGNYCGGAIAPGINLSMEALHMAAAKLPRVAIVAPKKVIGRATVPAMQSGLFFGYVGMVEGMVARIRAEFGAPMKVIATGGLSALIAGATDAIDEVDAGLTLRGLVSIYRRNRRD